MESQGNLRKIKKTLRNKLQSAKKYFLICLFFVIRLFCLITFGDLLAFEGEKSRNSCTLDSGSKQSLMRSARAAHSAGQNFAAFRNEFLQTVYVLVINRIKFFLAECANLFTGRFLKYLFYGCFFFHDSISLLYLGDKPN